MLDPLLVEFLERCGAMDRRHSGRSLFEHLMRTEKILASWGCDTDTRLAGLFHSIYGTNAFRNSSLDINDRAVLAELIGQRAENLVYLFHACHRPWALLEALQSQGVVSRHDGQYLAVPLADVIGLIEIECANLLEQGSGAKFFPRLFEQLELTDIVLGAGVMRGLPQLRATAHNVTERG